MTFPLPYTKLRATKILDKQGYPLSIPLIGNAIADRENLAPILQEAHDKSNFFWQNVVKAYKAFLRAATQVA